MMAVMGANVVMGRDSNCRRWIKAARGWEESPVTSKAVTASAPEKTVAAVSISRRRLRKLRQEANA